MKENLYLFFILLVCGLSHSAPKSKSFIVASAEDSKEDMQLDSAHVSLPGPIIYEMDIFSNVSNRFAKTLVSSKVKNDHGLAKETIFTVVFPEKAFISQFIMEIGGKSYKAYVKEKEEARRDYDIALSRGKSAGHVAVSARNSNRFTVSINVEPESKAAFLLTYEELLERREEKYELILNIHPGQIVKNLNIEVHIKESRPLRFVKTPSLRSGNEVTKNEDKLDPVSNIQVINSTTAIIKFSPDSEKQKQFTHYLGSKESGGLSGQFVVQYDVERDPNGGEVLLDDGYFIHFFAPKDLDPLPKHVVFVLDTSGSMGGTKISQLRDAMKSILNEIRMGDLINIIEFNNDAIVWDVQYKNNTRVGSLHGNYQEPFSALSELYLPRPTLVTSETIQKAKYIIDHIHASGGTNMIEGLETALYLVKYGQENNQHSDKKYQPIMLFLTDGDPNVGLSSREDIVKTVTKLNSESNVPIFSLSFGQGADKAFLRKLSLKNQGFSRHIYDASDASLQLQEFYKQISSPLLYNIKFKYQSDVEQVTKTDFPIYFSGSEIVVAGRYKVDRPPVMVECFGPNGKIVLHPVEEKPVTSLERLWAYLTVKQTLEKRDSAENKDELTQMALNLALQYSFVTDVTSLVVVKPNETSAVNTEAATKGNRFPHYQPLRNNVLHHQLASLDDRYAIKPRPGGFYGFSGMPFYGRQRPVHTLQIADISDHTTTRRIYGLSKPPTVPTPSSILLASTTPRLSFIIEPRLKNSLPWLTSAINSNGSLTIGQDTYEIGDDTIVMISKTECSKTPLSNTESGDCKLLKDCPEVHPALTDFRIYQQYFCPLQLDGRYAGVCCPKKTVPRYGK